MRCPCPRAPGPLEEFSGQFDPLFTSYSQRSNSRTYVNGLLLPRDRAGWANNITFSRGGLTGCYQHFNLAMTQTYYKQGDGQNSLRLRHLAAFIACFRYTLKLAAAAARSVSDSLLSEECIVRITRTVQIDFDQGAERQCLSNSFSSTTRAAHLAILDYFVSVDWREAWDNYLAMKREDREAVHILIVEWLTGC